MGSQCRLISGCSWQDVANGVWVPSFIMILISQTSLLRFVNFVNRTFNRFTIDIKYTQFLEEATMMYMVYIVCLDESEGVSIEIFYVDINYLNKSFTYSFRLENKS